MGFNKRESVFFVFKDGKTVADSQLRPRMYKTIEQAKKTYPGWIRGEAELVEYAPVVHGRWEWFVEQHGDPMYGIDEDFGYRCSECKMWADEWGVDGDIYEEPPTHLHYCPNCGAKMEGGIPWRD